MALIGDAYTRLVERVTQATEPGKITLWTERIAQLAKEIGLPTEMIDWSGSPRIVASKVVQLTDSWSYISKLETNLEKLELEAK